MSRKNPALLYFFAVLSANIRHIVSVFNNVNSKNLEISTYMFLKCVSSKTAEYKIFFSVLAAKFSSSLLFNSKEPARSLCFFTASNKNRKAQKGRQKGSQKLVSVLNKLSLHSKIIKLL